MFVSAMMFVGCNVSGVNSLNAVPNVFQWIIKSVK